MAQAISRWTPASNVVTHAGEPIPTNFVFFVAPPPQIGEVYSAWSGWQGDKRAGSGIGSTISIALLALIGAMAGAAVLAATTSANVPLVIVGAVVMGGLFGFLWFRHEARKNAVTYTGAQGIARYRYNNDPVKREQGEVFSFANAVELRTSQTRHYTNGIYTGTDYGYTWTGRDGKVVYRLAGRYTSEKGTPKAADMFHYARAAEAAWSRYLLTFVNEELQRSGAFRFNLRGNNCVVAGPGYLDLYMNGQQVRCAVQDIENIDMSQGVITLRRKDAKSGFLGIGSSGIFRFTYSELANGRVFLMLLDQLVGVG